MATLRLSRNPLTLLRLTPSRAFSTTPLRQLKEDAVRGADEVESKKQEQLKKQEQGKGEWHEELASGSESSVKADRSDTGGPEELMKQTANKAQKERTGK